MPRRAVLLASLYLASIAALAPGARADDAPPRDALEIATYNVQFATPELPPLVRHLLREWPGHKPNVRARAEAIAARLACFDVIALQETVNDRRREELADALETHGGACAKPSRLPSGRMFEIIDGPGIPANATLLPLADDELALASRLPIVVTASHKFERTSLEESIVAKGVVHARLRAGADDMIDVFVTHLQAGQESAEVRRGQIAELARFVRDRVNGPGSLVLVMGDFNIWGGAVDRADPASEYHHLVRALDAAVAPRRVTDLWLATHADDPERASGTKPRVHEDGALRPREKRIDYVFVAGAAAGGQRTMRVDFFPSDLIVDGAPVGHLSNHAALLAEIELPGALPPRLMVQAMRDKAVPGGHPPR